MHGLIFKDDDWGIAVCSMGSLYCAFIEVRQNASNVEMVQLSHSLILGFMEEVRGREKKGEEKFSEIGWFKTVLKDDLFYYNIDNKLNKH